MEDLVRIVMAVFALVGFPLLLYAGFVGIGAWKRRLEGKPTEPDLVRELEDLRARVGDLEQVQGRVEEIEERLDFAERLLAREKTQSQIQGER